MTDAQAVRQHLTAAVLQTTAESIRAGISRVPDEIVLRSFALTAAMLLRYADAFEVPIKFGASTVWIDVPMAEQLGIEATWTMFGDDTTDAALADYQQHNDVCLARWVPVDPAGCPCKPHPIFAHEDGCRYEGTSATPAQSDPAER